jgi:chromatin segregation and condensation protein Rec8/ScpA/Scc1 (kleisin family)
MNATVEREIDLSLAGAGMVLAAPLLDAHGSMLLPQGSTLTDAVLNSLRRRGVERCTISLPADAVDPAERARQRELACARLQHLFRHSARQDANPELLRVLTAFRNRD